MTELATQNWTDTLPPSACEDAVRWCKSQPDAATAWAKCKRADRMLWLVGKSKHDRKRLVLCACECVRRSLTYVKEGEERPHKAIELAQWWARDEDGITLDDVRRAAHASSYASAAASAAASSASAHAASSYASYAAYAAASSSASAHAASSAHAAAAYAAYAASAASASSARITELRLMADIVRAHFPAPPRMK